MTRPFLDAGVLQLLPPEGLASFLSVPHAILDDAARTFVTSAYIRMEVLPKALYHRQSQEVRLYERFFCKCSPHSTSFHGINAPAGLSRLQRDPARDRTRNAGDAWRVDIRRPAVARRMKMPIAARRVTGPWRRAAPDRALRQKSCCRVQRGYAVRDSLRSPAGRA